MRECGGDPQAPFKIRDGLGKIQRKPPIMAITLFLDCDRAKARGDPPSVWEKLQRNPPMMAIALFSIALVPKTATLRRRWEKFDRKPPMMATTL